MRSLTIYLTSVLAILWLVAADPAKVALAADDQASLRIFADAQVMRIAGVPEIPKLPGIAGKLAGKIPGMGGEPQRMLSVTLFAPLVAPEGATASLGIPAGLKLGPELDLALYRPQAEPAGEEEVKPEEVPDFTVLRYWGSSPTVKDGQPETINWGNLTPEQEAMLRAEMQKAEKKSPYLYKEGWTTAYWPSGKATGIVDKKASLVGKYALTTDFTGNAELEAPKGVDFLEGIKLKSPDLSELPPLDQAMVFRWEPVKGVLGYHAVIVGMKGENTMITWSSSEVKEDTAAQSDYLDEERITELVKEKVLMAPDCKEVTVPSGIFEDCDIVFLTLTGYGRGIEVQGQLLSSLQTRTILMVMLGGKQAEERIEGGEEETEDGE